jgi:hypothetical protein
MSNFKINIDKIVSKILNEEIENKVRQIYENLGEGEWTEIEVGEELHGNQKKIDVAPPKGKITAADFKKLRDKKETKEGDDMDEAETEEGNAFTDKLRKTPKGGKFTLGGKEYTDNSNLDEESKKSSLKLTEDELIDLIEQIVMEQSVKDIDEKANISKKSPEGLKKTEKVLGLNKKENDDYAKEVIKKMKDYMKDMFSGEKSYDENPDDFPQSNYDMEKEHNEKKYHPSDAVDEYIEAFAYPGMTNLVYDEIKPDDEMISNQLKGSSKNGNAVTDEVGEALGNVSKRSEKVGARFKKNFDDNLYGAEQMNVSYKRQSQPVDIAGDKRQSGGLKKSSSTKAQKIMNQLESKEEKKSKIISEEMEKMKNLIGYNRKTQ